ncbi:MAG: D-alanyl-D-alanine carboxypeptidase [Legionellales bacterium]|nr:D-alanyl-D-alanine carboxypeptidase [Legionellales bacterium]
MLISALILSISSVFAAAPTPNAPAQPATSPQQPYPDLVNLPKPNMFTPGVVPEAPNLDAKGYILIDANSGKVLAEKNADDRMEPASLTKLVTLYVTSSALAEKRINLTDKVIVSKDAWATGGSRMFLKVGQEVTVQDLINGIVIDSGNDACMALAEYVGGSTNSFVDLMNQAAKQLGMTNSHFVDPTGLPDPNHYTTPRDLAILTRTLIKSFPQYYHWYDQKWFTFNGIRQPNRNRLLWWDNTVDGLKTGHTEGAGFCLIASAERHGMRLISIVMGAPSDNSRATDSQRLLNYGFRFYETHQLYSAEEMLTQSRVWKGTKKYIPLGLSHDFYVTIPSGEYKHLTAQVKLTNELRAPISKGQQYGDVVVTLNGKPYADLPLVALQDDPKGSAWRRFSDSVALTFHHIF